MSNRIYPFFNVRMGKFKDKTSGGVSEEEIEEADLEDDQDDEDDAVDGTEVEEDCEVVNVDRTS